MRRLLAICAAVAAATLLGSASAAEAGPAATSSVAPTSPASWSAPVRAMDGQFGNISEVVDSTGHVHLAVVGPTGVWYATNRSGSWRQHRVFRNTAQGDYTWPSLALDEHDRVHIAAQRIHGEGDAGVWYVTDAGRAPGTFGAPVRIAPPGNGEPQLKASGGHLFLVVDQGWCCVGDGTIRMRTNVSGRWTVSTIGRGQSPSLRLGTDHLARVAYVGNEGRSVWYAIASTPTGHFTRERIPSPATSLADTRTEGPPLLALTRSNQPRIAWAHGLTSVLYAQRDSSGWHQPETVTNALPLTGFFGFDVDTQGRANVAIPGENLRMHVLSHGRWHVSTVATGQIGNVAVRRGLHGQVVVAWSASHGIWVAHD